jgi:hypothetical protein
MKTLPDWDWNRSPRVWIVGDLLLRTPAPQRIKRKPPDMTALLKGEVVKGMDVLLSGDEILLIGKVLAAYDTRSTKF